MRLSHLNLLALMIGFSALLTGCCAVPCSSPCGREGIAACGGGCSSGCETGSCGEASCSSGCECSGLMHGEIARRIKTAIVGGCCNGCGEYYCDEQVNEPPVCDPCAGNGEFTGESCGPCKPLWQRMKMLMGTSYHGKCGCNECNHGCGHDMYSAAHHGSGYCSSCRDGVSGVPHSTVRHSSQPQTHHHDAQQPMRIESQAPTRATKSNESIPNTPSKPDPTSKLEPVPDPLSRSTRPQSRPTSTRVAATTSRR